MNSFQRAFLIVLFLFGYFMVVTESLQCYQCGQYNDGVGSITPCINETYMKLKECPRKDHKFCIKYVSEGTTVRDCVPKCSEREDWGSRTYCCKEDACNSGPEARSPMAIVSIVIFSLFILFGQH